MQKRKSAVDLTDMAIGILILGIVVTIGATILLNVRDNQVTEADTGNVNDEALTTVAEGGETLSEIWVSSVNSCVNATDDILVPTTNYTTSIDANTGYATVSFTGELSSFNNTDWNCNYTVYNTSDPRFSLPDDAAIGLSEYGNWFDIIVIVGVAGLILTLIFMAFGKGRGEAGVQY